MRPPLDDLRIIDDLATLSSGEDEEAVEYLVGNRVAGLWVRYINEGRASVDPLLHGDGGRWFTAIKSRFLEEVDSVEHLAVPPGWSFAKDGRLTPPNLMQRYVAWAVRERRRIGNWSGVGAGKTLSAVLAARVAGARRILVVTNNATVKQWASEIQNAYPDSQVHHAMPEWRDLDPGTTQYLVLNYEKFQVSSRGRLVRALLDGAFDFVVLDEVQLVKQRDERASQRREALVGFLTAAAERTPDLRVLAMSATPVINNLREAKALLEATIGLAFDDLETVPTLHNALALHRALMVHGFRYRPPYEQEMRTVEVPVVRNDLLEALRAVPGRVLGLEQVLLPAKLEAARAWFGRATLVYAHYVDGMIAPARTVSRTDPRAPRGPLYRNGQVWPAGLPAGPCGHSARLPAGGHGAGRPPDRVPPARLPEPAVDQCGVRADHRPPPPSGGPVRRGGDRRPAGGARPRR